MFILYSKLKTVKAKLKVVNKDLYVSISQKVKIARQKVEAVQSRLLQRHCEVNLRKVEQDCLHEFIAVQRAEEAFLKQKARNKWLTLGDQNNRFFHSQVSRNAIKCLIDSEGNRLEDPARIKHEVVSFYQQLLGQSYVGNEGNMMNKVSALMPNQLSDESKLFLQKEVTEAEIKATMFSLGNEKAPGPDGFTAYFFKKSWSIIGRDVCHAVKSFFQSGSHCFGMH